MKYLKLFEDYDDYNEDEERLSEDPIINIVLSDIDEETKKDDYDIARAIACYIHEHNENTPYIHYLRNLLKEFNFKPSPSFTYKSDDLDDSLKRIFDEFVNTNIYTKVLNSSSSYQILKYLKDKYYGDFYKQFSLYGDTGEIDKSKKMGDMGYDEF